jgi:hypothetical protein
MSQSKETSWESEPDGARDGGTADPLRHDVLSSRLRSLLDVRAQLLEQVMRVDREIDRVRRDAAESARLAAERIRNAAADGTFTVALRDFVRGAADPPEVVDRADFERCLGRVVLALRRDGDSLARTEAQVRYHAHSGRVVAIGLRQDAARGERPVYRRFDLGSPLRA